MPEIFRYCEVWKTPSSLNHSLGWMSKTDISHTTLDLQPLPLLQLCTFSFTFQNVNYFNNIPTSIHKNLKKSFQFVIFSDVCLHPFANANKLLAEFSSNSNYENSNFSCAFFIEFKTPKQEEVSITSLGGVFHSGRLNWINCNNRSKP